VGISRNPAPVVAHGDVAIGVEFDLNPRGVAGDRFVHGVVNNFGDHMVQRAVVLAADVHAGAQADVFHVLKHLD